MEKNKAASWQERNDFIVRYPLDELMRIMKEAGYAARLFCWYVGRVTVEYVTEPGGIRFGGVLGGVPLADFDIAKNFARMDCPCSTDAIYSYRRTLQERGNIGWHRTRSQGLQTLVIGTEKFLAEESQPAPDWAKPVMASMLERWLGNYGSLPPLSKNTLPTVKSTVGTVKSTVATVKSTVATVKFTVLDQRSSEGVSEKAVSATRQPSEGFTHENQKAAQSDGKCPMCHVDKPKRPDPSGIVVCSLCGELYRQSAKEQSEVTPCQ